MVGCLEWRISDSREYDKMTGAVCGFRKITKPPLTGLYKRVGFWAICRWDAACGQEWAISTERWMLNLRIQFAFNILARSWLSSICMSQITWLLIFAIYKGLAFEISFPSPLSPPLSCPHTKVRVVCGSASGWHLLLYILCPHPFHTHTMMCVSRHWGA